MTAGAAVNHVGHCVVDLDRSTRFYVELLGFEIDRDLTVPDEAAAALLGIDPPVGLRARYLRLGEFQLELLHFDRVDNPAMNERVFNEPGLTHLSVSVADLEAVTDRIPEFAGEVVTRLPGAVVVRDPDGQLVELLPMGYHRQVRGLDEAG